MDGASDTAWSWPDLSSPEGSAARRRLACRTMKTRRGRVDLDDIMRCGQVFFGEGGPSAAIAAFGDFKLTCVELTYYPPNFFKAQLEPSSLPAKAGEP